ncbi:MAG: hypothetical protein K2N79_01695, partial [Muribaculaceae bacterium]|nr:hypothetical protein [Muribaculaceae bacterium]
EFSKYIEAPKFIAQTSELCQNVNADLLDGCHANAFMQTNRGATQDFNDAITCGAYRIMTGHMNNPSGDYGQLLVVRGNDGNTIAQLAFPYDRTTGYLRTGNPVWNPSGAWRYWRELAFTDSNVASATNATKWNDVEMSNTNLRRRYTINLESYPTTNFYPITFGSSDLELDCEIHSNNRPNAYAYNQNHIHFLLTAQGWTDTPKRFTILSQGNYTDTEITIGAIGYGVQEGERCIWVRGGNTYRITSNFTPMFHSSDYYHGNEIYSVGTNLTGGSNNAVHILWQNNRGDTGLATTQRLGVRTLSPEYDLDVNGDICTRTGRIYLTPSVWIEYDAANDVIRSNKTFASNLNVVALAK